MIFFAAASAAIIPTRDDALARDPTSA